MFCSKCGSEMPDNSVFCGNCGAPTGAAQPSQSVVQDALNPKDHTSEFDPKDISDNKVMAMIPYLMGTVGVIIALLASRESAFTYFHVRQALKITITTLLLGIVTAILCWTVIVPIISAVCVIVLFVIRIISFFQVCMGQAKEVTIIHSFGFLK